MLFQCTNKKAWKDIAAQLGIGPSSSGAYTLKVGQPRAPVFVIGVYIVHFSFTPLPGLGRGNKKEKKKVKKKVKNEKNEKDWEKIERIFAGNVITYIRVLERGGKVITKNIQDYIWRREERGKYMM